MFVVVVFQQQRENRPCQQQVQKIASESMIPTYRSGTDSLHKSNQSGPNSKQQQQQQNNSSSFSANAPKADGKNAVNNESNQNQNQNQCNSPVKRRSISQIDVRHFFVFYSLFGCVCVFDLLIRLLFLSIFIELFNLTAILYQNYRLSTFCLNCPVSHLPSIRVSILIYGPHNLYFLI